MANFGKGQIVIYIKKMVVQNVIQTIKEQQKNLLIKQKKYMEISMTILK